MDEKAIGLVRNPFGKPWGLQMDEDLWKMAWNAVAIRGSKSETIRKVKAHATEEDSRKGLSKHKDRKGNEKADELADDGVDIIGGKGLVKAGEWIAVRHQN